MLTLNNRSNSIENNKSIPAIKLHSSKLISDYKTIKFPLINPISTKNISDRRIRLHKEKLSIFAVCNSENKPVKFNSNCTSPFRLSPDKDIIKKVKMTSLNNSINHKPFELESNSIKENSKECFMNDYYKSIDAKLNRSKKEENPGKYVEVKELLTNYKPVPLSLDILQENFPNFIKGKISQKEYGYIKSYAANTNQGILRSYNEDRVSIVVNLLKPKEINDNINWPNISFFGVFDGHGGFQCSQFLRENLLKYICINEYFPENIKEAIKFGFQKAENDFLNNMAIKDDIIINNSGSCGLIFLLVNEKIYIANVGDSRCLISLNNGKIQKDVTRDHKPNFPYEKSRIIEKGGRIFQTQSNVKIENDNKILLGPFRVMPGKLSVSRTIGDVGAKIEKYGGKEGIILPVPDIFEFDLNEDDIDFLILGCDGIYDELNSKEILDSIWMIVNKCQKENEENMHNVSSNIVDFILKAAMVRKSLDNISIIFISFKNLLKLNYGAKSNEKFQPCSSEIELLSEENKDNTAKKRKKMIRLISDIRLNSENNFEENGNHYFFNKQIIKIINKKQSDKLPKIKIENKVNNNSNSNLNSNDFFNCGNSNMNLNYKNTNGKFSIEDKSNNRLNSYHNTNHNFYLNDQKFKLNKDVKVFKLNPIKNIDSGSNHREFALNKLKMEDRKIFGKNIKKLNRNLTIGDLEFLQ